VGDGCARLAADPHEAEAAASAESEAALGTLAGERRGLSDRGSIDNARAVGQVAAVNARAPFILTQECPPPEGPGRPGSVVNIIPSSHGGQPF
jgi:NAD(P)-dependent dehydrogenase (short-subunit alcohol dehydrogenase family)